MIFHSEKRSGPLIRSSPTSYNLAAKRTDGGSDEREEDRRVPSKGVPATASRQVPDDEPRDAARDPQVAAGPRRTHGASAARQGFKEQDQRSPLLTDQPPKRSITI